MEKYFNESYVAKIYIFEYNIKLKKIRKGSTCKIYS